MGSITIRRLDDQLKTALRLRAAAAGRSLEAEVRVILAAAIESQGQGQAAETLYDAAERFFPRDIRLDEGLDCSGADRFPVTAPDFS